MSSTRHAQPGKPLRQERFASSFEGGLLANLVAKRCAEMEEGEGRATVWFLQWLSWQPGGLAAAEKTIYGGGDRRIVSKGTRADWEGLKRVCLDPLAALDSNWGIATVLRKEWIMCSDLGAQTTISRRVFDALDYTRQARCLTLIDGPARIGKSFSAQKWCNRSAGIARYAEVPPSNDDIGFFRAIGRALGVSSSLQLKAAEIRSRIEEVLQVGDLMLVLDEAHYLWPQNWYRYAAPARVNWLMTAAANHGVAVALVTTPQFFKGQKQVEQLTKWNSEQFVGRIGHVERLPKELDFDDLVAVAKSMAPQCDRVTWRALAAFAKSSQARLGCMDAIIKRARWFARQDGRMEVSAREIRRVMKERVSSFDNPFAKAADAKPSTAGARGRGIGAFASRQSGDVLAGGWPAERGGVAEEVAKL